MKSQTSHPDTERVAGAARLPALSSDTSGHSTLAHRKAAPHTREDAEERYVAARDAWTAAMRAANSGRPADLASLALAQEAYEEASAERERWMSGARVAIPVQPDKIDSRLQAAIGQELAWRQVKHHEKPEGFLGRLKRRITG